MTIAIPYANGALMAVLRAALTTAGVGTRYPADLATRVPYLVARPITGGSVPDPRLGLTKYVVQLDGYATETSTAHQLVASAVTALVGAWRAGTNTGHGHITNVQVTQAPAELDTPEQAAGISRVVCTCNLVIRP